MPNLIYYTYDARERAPSAKVFIRHDDNQWDVTQWVSRDAGAITIQRQFGTPIAGATVRMVGTLPFTPAIKDIIEIHLGYNGQVRPRFTGVIVNPSTQSYPYSWTLQCSDILWIADFAVQENRAGVVLYDDEGEAVAAQTGGIVLDGPGGTPNNVPANDAVLRLLRDWAGIPEFRIELPLFEIRPGVAWVLGQLSPVVWSGVSPLQAALEIVSVLGYWLFCDEAGYIRARKMTGRPPDQTDYTLEEGVNVLSKAATSISRDVAGVYNQVVVTGANTLIVGENVFPVTDSRQADLSQFIPDGKYRQLAYSNRMIEYVTEAQAGDASCEAVGKRLMSEVSRPPAVIQGTVKGNPFLQIGQSIGYIGPRLGFPSKKNYSLHGLSTTYGGGIYEEQITLDGGVGSEGYTTTLPPESAFTTRLMFEVLGSPAGSSTGSGGVFQVMPDRHYVARASITYSASYDINHAVVGAAGGSVNVSNNADQSIWSGVAQAPDGNVHVVWVDTVGSDHIVRYAKGTWASGAYAFGAASDLDNVGSYQYAQPAVAVSPNGTVCTSWGNGTVQKIQTWSAAAATPSGTPATTTAGIGAALASDSNNDFHLVTSSSFQIQYRLFRAGAFIRTDTWSDEDAGSNRPDVAVATDDSIHVVWDGNNTARYRGRATGDATAWGAITDISAGIPCRVTAGLAGTVHIVFSNDYNIQYRRKTLASGFTNAQSFTGGSNINPTVGCSSDGTVVAVWTRDSTATASAISDDNGTTWGAASGSLGSGGGGDEWIEIFCDASTSISHLGSQAVTSWLWSCPGGVPTSGATETWMTRVPATQDTAVITLVVSDATGKFSPPLSKTIPLKAGGSLPSVRILSFAAESSWYITPDGGRNWHSAALSTLVVPPISAGGGGPGVSDAAGLLSGGESGVAATIDLLVTDAVARADPGEINFLWQNEKVPMRVWACVGAGVHFSSDGGVTFGAAKVPPVPEDELDHIARWVVESADTLNLIDVLAGRYCFTSFDGGVTWTTALMGPEDSAARCYTSGHGKHWVGFTSGDAPLQSIEGATVAFPGASPAVTEIRAVTMLVDKPLMYAFDAQGRIWKMSADDGTSLSQIAVMPDA